MIGEEERREEKNETMRWMTFEEQKLSFHPSLPLRSDPQDGGGVAVEEEKVTVMEGVVDMGWVG